MLSRLLESQFYFWYHVPVARMQANITLPLTFLKEDKQFIAYSPALDLSACGKTLEEARRRFGEAALLFIEELHKRGTLEEVFADLGWHKRDSAFVPPLIIGQESYTIPARA